MFWFRFFSLIIDNNPPSLPLRFAESMEDAAVAVAAAEGGGETGEVRKIRVVYFLTRNGRTEQPHLMRVHHRNRNGSGVRLRDVKRWLSELRGKYIPESHAWSYKRRYKSGYVWLDITDDDLITPIDDNEYVLMGSFFPTVVTLDDEINNGKTNNPADVSDCDAKSNPNVPPSPISTANKDKSVGNNNPPPSTVAGINKPAFSSSSSLSKSQKFLDVEMKEDECPRRRFTTYVDVSTQTPDVATFTNFDPHCDDVAAKKTFKEREVEDPVRESRNNRRSKSSMVLGDSRKGAGGGDKRIASNMFRNLITCGGSETRDSAMIPVYHRRVVAVAVEREKPEKNQHSKSPPPYPVPENCSTNEEDVVVEEPGKINKYNSKQTTFPEPICSECGKSFNPRKLFSHMNSCNVSRMRRKNSRHHQESSIVGHEEAKNSAMFSFMLSHS